MSNNAHLFISGHDALRFAYSFSAAQYPVTLMSIMMGGKRAPLGKGRGLLGLDGAAEAGNIKRVISGLPAPLPFVIAAQYSLLERDVRAAAACLICDVTQHMGPGAHKPELSHDLICRFFGAPGADGNEIKLAALADRYGHSAATITRRWQVARNRLYDLDRRAIASADEALTDAGIVG